MVGVLIYELVLNSRQQGTPLSFKVRWHMTFILYKTNTLQPVVNPMLGPSSSALINLGARFPPCMKLVTQVPPTTLIGCQSIYLLSRFSLTIFQA